MWSFLVLNLLGLGLYNVPSEVLLVSFLSNFFFCFTFINKLLHKGQNARCSSNTSYKFTAFKITSYLIDHSSFVFKVDFVESYNQARATESMKLKIYHNEEM